MHRTVVATATLGAHESVIGALEREGCAILRLPEGANAWPRGLIDQYAPHADAYVGTFRGIGLPREVIAASPRLRAIVSPIIGVEHIDVDAATEAGVIVAHGAMPENFEGMAEAGVMLIASLRKELPQKVAALRAGKWKPAPEGRMVSGATVGFLGFGRIGQGIAARLGGWGCALIAHDPYIASETAAARGVRLVSFDELLSASDVLLALVTLTPETHHIIDAKALARMKPGASLINIGRGGCVDDAALAAALDEGRLASAAIDAWEIEPPPQDHPLRDHPKVIGTAHNVGHSAELYASIPVAAAENTLRALRGEPPLYIKNPAALARWRERIAIMSETDNESAP